MATPKSVNFRVSRSTVIAAPAERIYPLIADFHRWTEWSPFDKLDPAQRRTYGGAASGVGATYGWEGNAKAGAGTMEIVEAAEPARVSIRLAFSKPFNATNTAEFTLAAQDGGTEVTWAMTGAHTLMSKAIGLFTSMDKMVGPQFAAGLADMKRAVEG